MTYSDARYSLFWGYGPHDLSHWRANSETPQAALDNLLDATGSALGLQVKANVLCYPLGVTSTRRSKYERGRSVREALARVSGSPTEFGVYVFDRGFSRDTPPLVIANFHAASRGEIAGRALVLADGTTKASTFLLFAVATAQCGESVLRRHAHDACSLLSLSLAFAFRDVGYLYDGSTPLEWAYKNHSARLRSGKLLELAPAGGEPLN